MDLHDEFNKACDDYDDFREIIQEARGFASEEQRELMDQLAAELDGAMTQLRNAFPENMKQLDESIANTRQEIADIQASLDETQKAVAEEATKAEPPEAEEEPTVADVEPVLDDISLGQLVRQLQDELRQKYGIVEPKVTVSRARPDDREIWQDLSNM
jgi:DNA repair exonuclease SbcCD ATPase subunit